MQDGTLLAFLVDLSHKFKQVTGKEIEIEDRGCARYTLICEGKKASICGGDFYEHNQNIMALGGAQDSMFVNNTRPIDEIAETFDWMDIWLEKVIECFE